MITTILLAVTTRTWLITGLGFGMVLLILFLFIYIIKGLDWFMQKLESRVEKGHHHVEETKPHVLPSAPESDIPAIATALFLNESEDDMAAVAMALSLYFDNAHDIVFPTLTLKHRPTQWNAHPLVLTIFTNNQQ